MCNNYPQFIINKYLEHLRSSYHFKDTDIARNILSHNKPLNSPIDSKHLNNKDCFRLFKFMDEQGFYGKLELEALRNTELFYSEIGPDQQARSASVSNAPTLLSFLNRLVTSLNFLQSHKYWLTKTKGAYRLYHDFVFAEEGFTAPQAAFYLIIKEINKIFSLKNKDMSINFSSAGIRDESGFETLTNMMFNTGGNLSFIQFNINIETVKNPYHNPFLERMIEQQFLMTVSRESKEKSLKQQLQSLIKDHLSKNNTILSAECAADFLHISKATLYRRLEKEGTCFSEVKNQCQMSIAKTLLREKSYSIAIISDQLGFSSSTAFIRAFKNSVGAPPKAYRKNLATLSGHI